MDFMISGNLFLKNILMMALVSSASVAGAADKLSIKDWGKSFETALNSKNSGDALKLLDFKSLEKDALPKCVDCSSKDAMKKARVLFAKGNFDESLKLYNQVPKGSDYWFQAIEEKGWAYFRQNDSEKALAQTKTLVSPQFGEVVNSEAYFLRSLTQLRICDYKGVFETHEIFKERQKARILEVQNLSKTGMNAAFAKALTKVTSFPVKASDVAESLLDLPVLYYKDTELQGQMLRFKVAEKALEVLQNRGTHPTLQSQVTKIQQDSLDKMKSRLKKLAQEETDANFRIVQKLNLIEVEAIQRIHTDMKLAQELYSKGDFKKTGEDQLVFMDDGRPWIDELDKYDVAAKTCPQNIRRKM
ncbi:tetratricopeptide repeat protein [Bdellovibrio bacteriovorus]|uniref:tetratricopeptide repeat protein n=1 Tax=Bdellovibrio bacteriovorus TaxID=959 RepID=UPI003A81075D